MTSRNGLAGVPSALEMASRPLIHLAKRFFIAGIADYNLGALVVLHLIGVFLNLCGVCVPARSAEIWQHLDNLGPFKIRYDCSKALQLMGNRMVAAASAATEATRLNYFRPSARRHPGLCDCWRCSKTGIERT